MKKRVGTYVVQKVIGESYKAYVPRPLPPDPPLDLEPLYPYLDKAMCALAELSGNTKAIPNTALFVYMYVRKEALLSSQIEGTQSSFSDLILFEHHQKPEVSLADVEGVSNYVKAMHYGLDRLKAGFPLSLRLLCEIHRVLLSGGRGALYYPGEFRRSQNWIGGTRPGNAFFVPPPVEDMHRCLSDLEKFLYDTSLPVLIKVALVHLQFETIHPFLDGNGRLGRLLISLLLCESGTLNEPVLYLSLYLKQNRTLYYDLLQEVRERGTWEAWIEFFLEGIAISAKQGTQTVCAINDLFARDSAKIESLGRVRFSCLRVFEYMKKLPQVSVALVARELTISSPTARSALNAMLELKVLEELSALGREKIYVYKGYLNILEEGAEPFKR